MASPPPPAPTPAKPRPKASAAPVIDLAHVADQSPPAPVQPQPAPAVPAPPHSPAAAPLPLTPRTPIPTSGRSPGGNLQRGLPAAQLAEETSAATLAAKGLPPTQLPFAFDDLRCRLVAPTGLRPFKPFPS